jgi:ketosteroid isomerase-like protein
MAMSEQEALIRRYLAAMEKADLDGALDCFADDGTATSPTYGEMPVRAFYEKLFADTVEVKLRVRSIYAATDSPGRWMAHFDYHWRRREAPDVDTELVDLFEISHGRIDRLRVIFAPPPAS